jgi:hypothetical protein
VNPTPEQESRPVLDYGRPPPSRASAGHIFRGLFFCAAAFVAGLFSMLFILLGIARGNIELDRGRDAAVAGRFSRNRRLGYRPSRL